MVGSHYEKMRVRRNKGFERCQHSRMASYKKVLKRWPWISDEAWLKGKSRDRVVNGVVVPGKPHTLKTLY